MGGGGVRGFVKHNILLIILVKCRYDALLCFSFQALVNHLRLYSHSAIYSSSMAPGVAQQIVSSMNIMLGRDGTREGESISSFSVFWNK